MSKTHTVKQGECMISIAKKYGFSTIDPITGDPANESLMTRRGSPSCLYPGDILTIPDCNEKKEVIATGQKHSFRVKTIKAWFTMILLNHLDEAMPNIEYELEIPSHNMQIKGKADGDGLIKEKIPADATEGILKLLLNTGDPDDDISMNVKFGHLDPVTEISGKKARLKNLGFYKGEIDDVNNDDFKSALKTFAQAYDLDDDCTDSDIEEKLQSIHPAQTS